MSVHSPASPRLRPSRARLAFSLALLALLAGCGGGEASPPAAPTPPVPPLNQNPVAAFSAPATLVAGGVAVLDSSGSTDPEGGVLVHAWDFGDGSRGGTARIAHVYSDAGSFVVRLTVTDPAGASTTLSRTVTVTAPAASRQVVVQGLITNLDGSALAGVSAAVRGTTSTAVSDAQGRVQLSVAAGVPVTLLLSKPGFADQTQVLNLPANTGTDGYFEAALMPRAAAQTLADAALGGSVTGAQGAKLTLPANALVNAAGAAVTGAVQVSLTPVDINSSALAAFPGRFEGINGDGTRVPIVSYGTVEFVLTQGGQPLQLRAGARATIEIPVYAGANLDSSQLAEGGSLPLWSLDERSGQWINEGNGTLVASPSSPTALAMRAEVGHLSWWNADLGYVPYRPRPRCINDVPGQYDSIFEQATICKMLAEMDKPIPAQGAASATVAAGRVSALAATGDQRAQAVTPTYRFPSARIAGEVPITGGAEFPVPPDFNLILTGTALNGTWRGQLALRGAAGTAGDVTVRLRPVAQGGVGETLTLPFDQIRAAAPARIDRYRFQATAGQGVLVTVSQSSSTLTGTVRLRNAANELLMTAPFAASAGVLQFQLTQAGEYTIEIEPRTNAPGGYRLQVQTQVSTERTPSVTVNESIDPGVAAVAANPAGTIWSLWPETEASVPKLKASRYLGAQGGWSVPETVADLSGYVASSPVQVGVDDAGNVLAAWETPGGPMLARRSAASGQWSAPLALAQGCAGGLGSRLAVVGSGNAFLMWRRSGTAGLCARRYAVATDSWSAEQVFATGVFGSHFRLVAAANGDAAAAWASAAGSVLTGVRVARFSGGAWETPVALGGSLSFAPSIAMSVDGTLFASWLASAQIDAAHLPAGSTTWSATQRVGTNSGNTFPHAAVWRTGTRFQVLWSDGSGALAAREFDASTAQWAAPQPISTGRAVYPVTAASGGGDMLVLWQGNKTAGVGIEFGYSRWNRGAGNWSTPAALVSPQPVLVQNPTDGYPDSAAIAVAGNGTAVMLWREYVPPALADVLVRATGLTLSP